MLDWGEACSAQHRTPEVQNRSHTITLRGAANTLKSGDLKSSTEVQQFRVLATAGNQGDTADQVQQGGGLVALGQELPGDRSVVVAAVLVIGRGLLPTQSTEKVVASCG